MIIPLILAGIISAILVSFGIYLNDSSLLNLGYSCITGLIIGALCNVSISKHYRTRDSKIHNRNEEILQKKREISEQIKSLEDAVKFFTSLISAIQAYNCSNPNICDGEIGTGYYDLCNTVLNRPTSMIANESYLSEEEIYLIDEVMTHFSLIETLITKKEFSKINCSDESLYGIGFVGKFMSINGKFKVKLDELISKLQYN